MKGCSSCSFYIEDIDILNLDTNDQIRFEKFKIDTIPDDTDIDLNELSRLLNGVKRFTCIGGLTNPNEKRENCKYYSNLSHDLDKSQLLQSFIAKKNSAFSSKSIAITIILSCISISATIFGILQSNKNRDLKVDVEEYKDKLTKIEKTVNDNKAIIKNDSIEIKRLNDKIKKLKHF